MDVKRERVEWSCGCTTSELRWVWQLGQVGTCSVHSASYNAGPGEAQVLDRDVQVVRVQG